jgi:uncharacterized protein (TIGR00290 family)
VPVREVLVSWSGGKDSSLALREVLRGGEHRVAALLTTVTEGYDRISMHGVRRELLHRQADSLELPLHEVSIPQRAMNERYEERMREGLRPFLERGVREVVFGDLFLEDVREYREGQLAKAGMHARFPIWGRNTQELAREFVRAGFRAVVVCLDPQKLDPAFAGRELDAGFFEELPAGVDPCGENGEFHTFVFDGPIFREPVPFETGEAVLRDGFSYRDLVPAPVD